MLNFISIFLACIFTSFPNAIYVLYDAELQAWAITFPKSKNFESMIIDFKESMDYGLLKRTQYIVDVDNNSVKGEIYLRNHLVFFSG